MKILILGASGMLGHTLLFELLNRGLDVYGTVREKEPISKLFPDYCNQILIDGIDAMNIESLKECITNTRPDVVINCIGIIKQLPQGKMPLPCIEINARLPHKVYEYCREYNCRLIHYSTDCVFDGKKDSPYIESDLCTANDYYGMTKFLGELHYENALTIRTSIIGNELKNKLSLIEWFLKQNEKVSGYSQVIYSGLPCTEHTKILVEHVLPNPQLQGLYQVSSAPISKYNLLKLVAFEYGKEVDISGSSDIKERKILSGEKFSKATGYIAPDWPTLIKEMHLGDKSFNNAVTRNK